MTPEAYRDRYGRPRIRITDARSVRISSNLRQQRNSFGECWVCGFCYRTDSPDDRQFHRRFHAEYVRPRLPKPDPRLADYAGDVRVDRRSPEWLHMLVYERARALQRDEGYDFAQWGKTSAATPHDNERDIHAFLLVENGNIPVGIVSFSWVDWQGSKAPPTGWHMCMAWVADAWRRKGILTRRWSGWRATYGDFTLEHPISADMGAFIAKVGHPNKLREWSDSLAPTESVSA